MKTVAKARQSGKGSVSDVCSCFALKRDAYYKYLRRYEHKQEVQQQVIELVAKERAIQPRVGTRKLYIELLPAFEAANLKIGRDALFTILREHQLLIRRKKASCRTTNSYHRFHTYKNMVKEMNITAPNQVWVADITYIRTIKGFCYLALITDLFSRKIVGHDLSDSLELAGCLRALKKALRHARPAAGLVHHSDRGIQYCSNQYVDLLKQKKIKISMTEENHCYENAVAERVNGILKDEFYLDQCFFDTSHARHATKNAIEVYNSKRLHLTLGYKTPNNVFKMTA